jgi:hypothetical protein
MRSSPQFGIDYSCFNCKQLSTKSITDSWFGKELRSSVWLGVWVTEFSTRQCLPALFLLIHPKSLVQERHMRYDFRNSFGRWLGLSLLVALFTGRALA